MKYSIKKLFRQKSLFIGLVCFLFTQIGQSQVSIGIKGVSPSISAKQTQKDFWESEAFNHYNLKYMSTQRSYGLGLSFFADTDFVFVMSDVIYRKSKVSYELTYLNTLDRAASNIYDKHHEISVPITAGIKKKDFKIGVGPVFNYKLQSEYGLEDIVGFRLNERKLNTGFQILAGVVIKDHIHVDVKHEIGFDSEGDNYTIMGNPLRLRSHPHSFSLSIGFFL